jgi:hypothetical protein
VTDRVDGDRPSLLEGQRLHHDGNRVVVRDGFADVDGGVTLDGQFVEHDHGSGGRQCPPNRLCERLPTVLSEQEQDRPRLRRVVVRSDDRRREGFDPVVGQRPDVLEREEEPLVIGRRVGSRPVE